MDHDLPVGPSLLRHKGREDRDTDRDARDVSPLSTPTRGWSSAPLQTVKVRTRDFVVGLRLLGSLNSEIPCRLGDPSSLDPGLPVTRRG